MFLTICLCLSVFFNLKAQNITNAEYFIDTDKGIGKNVPVTIPESEQDIDIAADFTADLSGLSTGIHFLYVRAQDETRHWSVCATKPFMVASDEVVLNIVAAEYFIDSDPGIGNGKPININAASSYQLLAFSLDLSGCNLGLHTLYTRVKSSDGVWSIHNSRLFFLTDDVELEKVVSLEYYFSGGSGNTPLYVFDEFTPAAAVEFSESDFLAHTSALEYNGQYTLHVRSLSSNGKYSEYSTVQFTFLNINTGTDELNNANILLYPNPASEFLYFKGLPEGKRLDFYVYNQLGGLVLNGELYGNRINVGELFPGNYYVVIKSEDRIFSTDVIINNHR